VEKIELTKKAGFNPAFFIDLRKIMKKIFVIFLCFFAYSIQCMSASVAEEIAQKIKETYFKILKIGYPECASHLDELNFCYNQALLKPESQEDAEKLYAPALKKFEKCIDESKQKRKENLNRYEEELNKYQEEQKKSN
jgi:hypothetical protein